MGRKFIEIPQENEGIRGSGGGGAQRAIAEFEPRVDLNMGRKFIEIPKENEGIRRSGRPSRTANALNLSLG